MCGGGAPSPAAILGGQQKNRRAAEGQGHGLGCDLALMNASFTDTIVVVVAVLVVLRVARVL
jgi:hypothetical protein